MSAITDKTLTFALQPLEEARFTETLTVPVSMTVKDLNQLVQERLGRSSEVLLIVKGHVLSKSNERPLSSYLFSYEKEVIIMTATGKKDIPPGGIILLTRQEAEEFSFLRRLLPAARTAMAAALGRIGRDSPA